MLASSETLANLFSQLHQCLEGEAISIGNIVELHTPSKYFFGGNIT
jgi:hypothetical protein